MGLFDLRDRTALVTGASSGLGASFARELAAAGAHVVAAARRTDRLDELVESIEAAGGRATAVSLDVNDGDSIRDAFAAAERAAGTVRILVNNAGISRSGFLRDLSEESWDAVLDTNLKAVWRVGAEAANRMIAASATGTIINISSVLAFGASKVLGPYMAAKAGVIQLTKGMAVEWADHGIRVNALAPGYFPTEINTGFFDTENGRRMIRRIPLGRIGALEELAGPLLLLASDASSYMTGSVVTVDGGHLCQQL